MVAQAKHDECQSRHLFWLALGGTLSILAFTGESVDSGTLQHPSGALPQTGM
jgi:hypothetical protein